MKGAGTTPRQDFKVQDTLTYLWTSAWGWNYPRLRAKGRRKRERETWRWRAATGCKRNLRMSTEGRQRGVAQGDLYWSPYERLNYKRILSTSFTPFSPFLFYIFFVIVPFPLPHFLDIILDIRTMERKENEEEILSSRNTILLSNRIFVVLAVREIIFAFRGFPSFSFEYFYFKKFPPASIPPLSYRSN